jgi:hypothetical protein
MQMMPAQQELLHLQVVAVVLDTFLIDMAMPPFLVGFMIANPGSPCQ